MAKKLNERTKLLEEIKVDLPPDLIYYNLDEVAVILNVTVQTVKKMRDRGELKTVVLGTLMGGKEVVSLQQLMDHCELGKRRAKRKRAIKVRRRNKRIKAINAKPKED